VGEQKLWGIRDIYVTYHVEEFFQNQDPFKLYEAADRLFQEGISHSGNLLRARSMLDQAIRQWKAQSGRIPGHAIELRKKLLRTEEDSFSKAMMNAKGAIAMREHERARLIYTQLLEELIDPQDPRREVVLKAQSLLQVE